MNQQRPQISRTQKKILAAFVLAVIGISFFLFQAVFYSARQKEIRESSSTQAPQDSSGQAPTGQDGSGSQVPQEHGSPSGQ